jgi:hypothetical protein
MCLEKKVAYRAALRQPPYESPVTLHSPETFGLQLPEGNRVRDRLAAMKIAHYCTWTYPAPSERGTDIWLVRNRIHPETLYNDKAEAAWTKVFYQYPVIFHTFQWSTTIHMDLAHNQISASVTKESLTHRSCAIQLLNRMLSAPMSHVETEIALLTVMTLAASELDQPTMDEMFAASPLPFNPPMPTNDFRVFAKLRRDPRHGPVMVHLIRSLGAWEGIKLPGLAGTLAMLVSPVVLILPHCLTQSR